MQAVGHVILHTVAGTYTGYRLQQIQAICSARPVFSETPLNWLRTHAGYNP